MRVRVCAQLQQWLTDDVAMADHPADVARRKEGLPWRRPVVGCHRPLERHSMRVVAQNALGVASGPGGVDGVEWVLCVCMCMYVYVCVCMCARKDILGLNGEINEE